MKNMHVKSFTLLLVFYFLVSSAYPYYGGTGEPNDPYQIATIADWNDLMHNPSDWNDCFLLISDINLMDVNVVPIGRFKGVLNGNNHILRNVKIDQPSRSNVGVFGDISNGQIKNLGIEDANIKGGDRVGGLVGSLFGGTISNSHVTGSISSNSSYQSYCGGLVGYSSASGKITNSYTKGFVYSSAKNQSFSAGLIAYDSGHIEIADSYSESKIFSSSTNFSACAGGLSGHGGIISNCYAKGDVSSTSSTNNALAGGLTGYLAGSVKNCYATGKTIASGYNTYVGGLIGSNHGKVTNCYSKGFVESTAASQNLCGGFIGYDSGFYQTTNSFWDIETSGQATSAGGIGKTTAKMKDISTFIDAGWDFLGENTNGMDDVWTLCCEEYPTFKWDNKSLTVPNIKFLTLPEAENLIISNGLTLGEVRGVYDSNISENCVSSQNPNAGSYVPCRMSINIYYSLGPRGYSGGLGTDIDPYRVSCVEDWQEIIDTNSDWDKCFILTADIDFQNNIIKPIGDNNIPFSGVFDGCRHVIRNIRIDEPNNPYTGLFSYVKTGEIRNLSVEDINVIGGENTGGLAGKNEYGFINACSVTGFATGNIGKGTEYNRTTVRTGGLVGYNNGNIESSFANIKVVSNNKGGLCYLYGGGLVGYNETGTITASYSKSNILGITDGNNIFFNGSGFAAYNSKGKISYCYSTGKIDLLFNYDNYSNWNICGFTESEPGLIASSFWDQEISKRKGSCGGKGLSAQEMKNIKNYQKAGWAGKGWIMQDGEDYPRLKWEQTEGIDIPIEELTFIGQGTEDEPYKIFSAEEFVSLSYYSCILDKNVELINDINLAGIQIYPIGILGAFSGTFNGNGFSINNATINQSDDCVGIFSSISREGQIINLSIRDVNISSGWQYVGGLAGWNEGKITSCYITGKVNGGSREIGGLVGHNQKGIIEKCSVTLPPKTGPNQERGFQSTLV